MCIAKEFENSFSPNEIGFLFSVANVMPAAIDSVKDRFSAAQANQFFGTCYIDLLHTNPLGIESAKRLIEKSLRFQLKDTSVNWKSLSETGAFPSDDIERERREVNIAFADSNWLFFAKPNTEQRLASLRPRVDVPRHMAAMFFEESSTVLFFDWTPMPEIDSSFVRSTYHLFKCLLNKLF